MRALLPLPALIAGAMCAALGCGSDYVEPSADHGGDTQTETGETGDPAACSDADAPWDTVQSYFWQPSSLWSDGERVIGHASTKLLIFDGETATWHAGVTLATTLREIEARELDQVWLVGEHAVEYWDGETTHATLANLFAPDVEVAADGEAWLISHPCEFDVCGSQLWRWQDDLSWLEVPLPDLPPVRSFWAGPDDELWVGTEDSLFAHRNVFGEWMIENIEDEGYEGWSHPNGWQNFLSFTADSLDVDAEGNLWATDDFAERVSFAHRSPAGEWSFSGSALVIADEGQQEPSVVIAAGDDAIVFRRGAERALRRFTVPGYLPELVSSDALGVDAVSAIAGPAERLALLSFGPKVTALDASADPLERETLVDIVSVPPARTSATRVDAAVSARGSSLVRFDGQQWTELLRIPDGPGGALIVDVLADSADSGWLVVGDGFLTGRSLWRWQGGQASSTAVVQGDDHFGWLWGTGPERVWLTGVLDGKSVIWKWAGDQWQSVREGGGEVLAVAGDDQSVFFLTDEGVVIGWHESAWRELGSVVPDGSSMYLSYFYGDGDSFARVGDELLLRVRGLTEGSGLFDLLMRWDGETWSQPEGLPPLQRLSNDGQGRAWAIGEGALYRHDGHGPADQGWEQIELDDVDDDTRVTASADGAVVHSPWLTSVFRYTCD